MLCWILITLGWEQVFQSLWKVWTQDTLTPLDTLRFGLGGLLSVAMLVGLGTCVQWLWAQRRWLTRLRPTVPGLIVGITLVGMIAVGIRERQVGLPAGSFLLCTGMPTICDMSWYFTVMIQGPVRWSPEVQSPDPF